jgi:alpha-beta hydrolase superfamily lysophospholipase
MQHKDIIIEMHTPRPYSLHGVLWTPNEMPVTKIIHIVHGMTEHIGRYEEFAEIMTQMGLTVVGFDLRGHGQNCGDKNCASFVSGSGLGRNDFGWKQVVDDLDFQIAKIKETYPSAEYYLLGFSLGSFVVRDYMKQIHPHYISGIILAGTGHQSSIALAIAKIMAKSQIKKGGIANTTDVIRKLAFETYNNEFQDASTPVDWLCSDVDRRKLYLEDELVRKDIAADLFYEMLNTMQRTGTKRHYKQNRNVLEKMPILIVSGDEDAVGQFGEGVGKYAKFLQHLKFANVHWYLLEDARHDIFHEYSCGAVDRLIEIIAEWLGEPDFQNTIKETAIV